MKFAERIIVRDIAGEHVIFRPSDNEVDLTTVISLNDTALFLYNTLKNRSFEVDDVVRVLQEEYEVTESEAMTDAADWIKKMRDCGLVE